MGNAVHKINSRPKESARMTVAQAKASAYEAIMDKAKKYAFEKDQLFTPKTSHLMYAMLDEVVDIIISHRAMFNHLTTLEADLKQAMADLEALRRTVADK